jgi:hypothetical protein
LGNSDVSLFSFYEKGRKDAVIKITVDDKGLHYDHLNGEKGKFFTVSWDGPTFQMSMRYVSHRPKKTWVLTLGVEGKARFCLMKPIRDIPTTQEMQELYGPDL